MESFIYSPIHHFIDKYFSPKAYVKKRNISFSSEENVLKFSIFFILLRKNFSFSKFHLLCFLKKTFNHKHKNGCLNLDFYFNLLQALAIWIKREVRPKIAYEKMAKIFGIEIFDFLNEEIKAILKKRINSESTINNQNYFLKGLNSEFLCKKQRESCINLIYFKNDEKLNINSIENQEVLLSHNDLVDIISIFSLFEYEINHEGDLNHEMLNFFCEILHEKNENLKKNKICQEKICEKIEVLLLSRHSDSFALKIKKILPFILKELFKKDALYFAGFFDENACKFQQKIKEYFENFTTKPIDLLKISFILKEVCWIYFKPAEISEQSLKCKFYVLLILQSIFNLKSSVVRKIIETKFLPLMRDFCYLAPKTNDFYRGRFIFESSDHSINKLSHSIFVLSLELIYDWASNSNFESNYYTTYEEMIRNEVSFHEKFIYLRKNKIKIRKHQTNYFINEERQKLEKIREKITNLRINVFFKPNNFSNTLEEFINDSDSMLLFLNKQFYLRDTLDKEDKESTEDSFKRLFEINEIVKIGTVIKNLEHFVNLEQLKSQVLFITDEIHEFQVDEHREEKVIFIEELLIKGFYEKVLGNEKIYASFNEYFIEAIENNQDWESLRILILIFERLCLEPDQFTKKLMILKMIERLTITKKPQILSIIEKEFLFLLPNEYSRNKEILLQFERSECFVENNKIYLKFKEYIFLMEDFVFDSTKYFSSLQFQNVYKLFISMEVGVREGRKKIVFKHTHYNSSSNFLSLVKTSDQSIKSDRSERDDF